MTLEAGAIVGGKYRLFKPLARGGMGAIWVARHTELDVAVAIKVIASDMVLSQTALGRFRHEARAAAQLRSPHVVQILDYGAEEGVPFMAMELLTGEDLGERLEKKGRLSLAEVVEILGAVCKALKLAHDGRIVHRDLKPGNIFLAQVGDEEVVKVLDFGIAKALTPDGGHAQTASATLVGSPLYMSPEQSRGDPVDGRSDLWSLAVVAYEALAGAPPFEGRGLGDLFSQICHGTVAPISTHGVVAPGLDAFFERALAKEPENRFASASQWIDALRACRETARLGRAASPEAETLEVPAPPPPASLRASESERDAAVSSARTGAANATNAGISSEVRKDVAAADTKLPKRAVWPWALAGAGALGLAGWGAFSLVGPGSTPRPSAGATVAPDTSAATPPSATESSPRVSPNEPTDPDEHASAQPPAASAPVGAPTASAVAAPSLPVRLKPVVERPTGSPKPPTKPTATTDDIFGIPKH